jgi:transcriptional regulator with XRE-family HTH domain
MSQVKINGSKLREVRMGKRMTTKELAERSGVSPRTIDRIESGALKEGVREGTLFAITKALEVELDVLIESAPIPAEVGEKSEDKKTA